MIFSSRASTGSATVWIIIAGSEKLSALTVRPFFDGLMVIGDKFENYRSDSKLFVRNSVSWNARTRKAYFMKSFDFLKLEKLGEIEERKHQNHRKFPILNPKALFERYDREVWPWHQSLMIKPLIESVKAKTFSWVLSFVSGKLIGKFDRSESMTINGWGNLNEGSSSVESGCQRAV